MKKIAILGATGSIGESTLEVVRTMPQLYAVKLLVAGKNVEKLAAAAREFKPTCVAIADVSCENALRDALHDETVRVFAGAEGISQAVAECGAEICVSAIVGSAGLLPTLSAIAAGMDIALANKETLVAAGALVMARVRESGVRLLPVDSEHNALFQCLVGQQKNTLRRLTLTASGGPFRGMTAEAIAAVTPAQALAHPTWEMGAKITIDSATLANKALEMIEAHWLFDIPYDKIDVLVHPQSVVHGLVSFHDGSVLAQMAMPDMCLPIEYALGYPDRLPSDRAAPDLARLGALTFEPPDRVVFPMLDLGIQAGSRGGTAAAVYSAANEEAVGLFLAGQISFAEIATRVQSALDTVPHRDGLTLDEILAAETQARQQVRQFAE